MDVVEAAKKAAESPQPLVYLLVLVLAYVGALVGLSLRRQWSSMDRRDVAFEQQTQSMLVLVRSVERVLDKLDAGICKAESLDNERKRRS